MKGRDDFDAAAFALGNGGGSVFVKHASTAKNLIKPLASIIETIKIVNSDAAIRKIRKCAVAGNRDTTVIQTHATGLNGADLFSRIFLGAIFGSLLFIFTIVKLDSDYGKQYVDVYHLLMGNNAVSARTYSVASGYFCYVVFHLTFYMYFYNFIDKIWNKYFIVQYDYWLINLFYCSQISAMILIVTNPTWWWVNVVLVYALLLLFLSIRIFEFKKQLHKNGYFCDREGCVSEIKEESASKIDLDLDEIHQVESIRMKMILVIRERLFIKAAFFGIPVIIFIWTSQAIRGGFSGELQYLVVGAYCVASLILVTINAAYLFLGWRYEINDIMLNAEQLNIEYFNVAHA